jgi:excisionase family DNA binding protein
MKRTGQSDPTDLDQVMTVDQVAAYLQLNRLTVYRYVREGRIPAAKIGKLYRILRADLDRYLEEQKVAPSARTPRASKRTASATPPPPPPPAPRQRRGEETFVDPQRYERFKERVKERDRAEQVRYPLEWVMRGFH